MARRRFKTGIIILLTLMFVFAKRALADREPPVVVDEQIVHNLTQPTTFAIMPLRYQRSDRYFTRLAQMVRDELMRRGYQEVDDTKADLIVIMAYQQTDVTQYLWVPPIYTRTVRLTMLDQEAYAKRQIVKRFEANTISRGEDSNLAFIYPFHIKAIFYNFPGPNRVNQTVIVKDLYDGGARLDDGPGNNPSFYYLDTDFPFEN